MKEDPQNKDANQIHLPPATPYVLIAVILAEALSKVQISRAVRWFFEVAKKASDSAIPTRLKFNAESNELRRAASSS